MKSAGFGPLDYTAVLIYLAAIAAMGFCFVRRQRSTADYFVGGREFHWLPVAVSMFASLFSAISYIAAPAEAYNNGMMYFLFFILVLPAIPIAVVVFVRFLRGLLLTTAYEYLERRFDVRVRLATSWLFLLLRSFYLGVVLFASGLVLEPATGWPVWMSVILVGGIATACTTAGGIRAVIWIEVVQFVVLLGGILIVLGILIASHPEGLGGIWSYAKARNHTFGQLWDRSFYVLNPFERVSLWVLLLSAVFQKLSTVGADQIAIQRYLSTRSERDASQSMIWGTLLGIPVVFLLFLTGLGLFYYYGVHPERAMPGMTGDQALMHFVANELPPGVGGVILAGILAAVINTACSVLNSLSTCTIVDFYGRILDPDASDFRKLWLAKAMTAVWGVVSILCAGAIMWLFGTETGRNPLIEVSNVTIYLFSGIILAIFLLGILCRRANTVGVLAGVAAGLAAALAVTIPYYFRELPEGTPKLSFLWINIVGCVSTLVVGYTASWLAPAPDARQLDGLTYVCRQKKHSLEPGEEQHAAST